MWNSYNSCWNDTAEDCGCVAGEGAELSSIDIWFPLYNNWPLLPAPPPPHLSIAVAWDLLFQSSSHIPCMRRAPGNPTRGAASKTHWHSEASPPRWAEPNIPRAEERPNESQTIGFHKLNGGFLPLQTKKRIAEKQDSWQALQMRSLGLELVLKYNFPNSIACRQKTNQPLRWKPRDFNFKDNFDSHCQVSVWHWSKTRF